MGLYDRRPRQASSRRAPVDAIARALDLFDPRDEDCTAKRCHERCPSMLDMGAAPGEEGRMGVAARIREKLVVGLAPDRLEIVDESRLHAGHAGAREGGESHFRVTVVARAFDGLSRVERQRRVNTLLADEFAAGLHALSLAAKTPEEAGGK